MATYTWDGLVQVGYPTENDGVYSGFTQANYFESNATPSTINEFECEFYFTTGNDVNAWQVITGQYNSAYNKTTPQFEVENGTFGVLLSSNGNDWDGYLMTRTISPNTNYRLYVYWAGGIIIALLKDLDNDVDVPFYVYQGSGSISSINWWTTMCVGLDVGFSSAWQGSIDLKHSYIKVNDQYFLCSSDSSGLCPYMGLNQCEGFYIGSNPISKIYLGSNLIYGGSVDPTPSGYVVYAKIVGSPTVNSNFVASGFSDSDYLTFSSPLSGTINSMVLQTAFYINQNSIWPAIIDGDYSINGNHSIRLTLENNNTLECRVTSDGSSYNVDIYGTTVFQSNTKYYVKLEYDNINGYKLYISTDGSSWTLEGTSSSTSAPYYSSGFIFKIGDNSSSGNSLNGGVYLPDTYIEINGNMRWQAAMLA